MEQNYSDLTKEKNLLQIYILSRKFPKGKFNCWLLIGFLILFVIYAFLSRKNEEHILHLLFKMVDVGISFGASILGFLIAGFTVFVTMTKTEIFVEMSKVPYKKTGESYLKYNLSQFMIVFINYILYLFLCFFIFMFGQPDGFFSLLSKIAIGLFGGDLSLLIFHKLPIYICFVAVGVWSMYLLILMKSFIYNIYQVVTTTVRWDLERRNE